MEKQKVAEALVRMAKDLIEPRTRKADSGDVTLFFNISDYFSPNNGRFFYPDEAKECYVILEEALANIRGKLEAPLKRELARQIQKTNSDVQLKS